MNIRTKVILSQAPLGAVLALIGFLSVFTVMKIGSESRNILANDFEALLAASKIRDELNEIDRLIIKGFQKISKDELVKKFDDIDSEIENISSVSNSPDEAETITKLSEDIDSLKERYMQLIQASQSASSKNYDSELEILHEQIKQQIEHLIGINQDAMIMKSDSVNELASNVNKLMIFAAFCAFVFGSLSSLMLTRRTLAPLADLGNAAREIGNGKLDSRVEISGTDEIGQLAREFNFMADRLEKYRQSSIGELLQAQLAMQAAIDSLPEPVMILTIEKKLSNANIAANNILGISVEANANSPIEDIQEPLKTKLEDVITHVLKGHGLYQSKNMNEAVALKVGDEKMYFLPQAQPVYEQGLGIVALTIVLQDVTRAYIYDLDKSQTLANISHELRVPLDSAHMAIHACIEETIGDLNDKQQEFLHNARDACEQMQSMIREILEVSRLEGRGQVQSTRYYHPTNLKELADNSISLFEKHIESRKLTMNIDFPAFMEDVWADSERLSVVFNNLISNAIKYSYPQKEVIIRAREEAGNVRCEVHNFGDPIPHEMLGKIFDKFNRSTNAGGAMFMGDSAGLGLFITREIILEHGGQIGVDSNAEDGTTFWFTLPAKRSFFE